MKEKNVKITHNRVLCGVIYGSCIFWEEKIKNKKSKTTHYITERERYIYRDTEREAERYRERERERYIYIYIERETERDRERERKKKRERVLNPYPKCWPAGV
jgi:hypothetical protein